MTIMKHTVYRDFMWSHQKNNVRVDGYDLFDFSNHFTIYTYSKALCCTTACTKCMKILFWKHKPMWYHFTLTGIEESKRHNKKCWEVHREVWTLIHCRWECKSGLATLENTLQLVRWLNIEFYMTQQFHSWELKTYAYTKTSTQYSQLYFKLEIGNNPNFHQLVREWIKCGTYKQWSMIQMKYTFMLLYGEAWKHC